MLKLYLSFVLLLFTTGLRFPIIAKRKLKQCVEFLENIPLDLSLGAWNLSAPETGAVAIVVRSNTSIAAISDYSVDAQQISMQMRLQQIGKVAVKKIPDNILLGILILIATELIKREVINKPTYPLALRTAAETSIRELEMRIDYLSSINWDMDPFIKKEFERLQSEPLEVLDKYLVTEILPNVDKELSPYLNKLTGDPKNVNLFVQNLKELIQLISLLLVRIEQQPYALQKTTGEFMKQIDEVGAKVEDAVKDWNRVILRIQDVFRATSVVPRNIVDLSKLYFEKRTAARKELPDGSDKESSSTP